MESVQIDSSTEARELSAALQEFAVERRGLFIDQPTHWLLRQFMEMQDMWAKACSTGGVRPKKSLWNLVAESAYRRLLHEDALDDPWRSLKVQLARLLGGIGVGVAAVDKSCDVENHALVGWRQWDLGAVLHDVHESMDPEEGLPPQDPVSCRIFSSRS